MIEDDRRFLKESDRYSGTTMNVDLYPTKQGMLGAVASDVTLSDLISPYRPRPEFKPPEELKYEDRPVKYEEGKAPLHLVPTLLVRIMARVYEEGIKNKYRRDSWKEFTVEKAREDLVPAAMRHLDLYRDGEFFDPVTKLPHLAHVIWNALTLLWHEDKSRKLNL